MTEFSKDLRKILSKEAYISHIEMRKSQLSQDKTEKFLFQLPDGETIESVYMPEKDRHTLCISTQVGCAMGCIFCKTGDIGLRRNLKAHEIVDQIITIRRASKPISNIVLMGMGEPLANFQEVCKALYIMKDYLKYSPRRITLSTVGLTDKILNLPLHAPSVNLAVSINAANNDVRDFIMPINKRYPLLDLIATVKRFPLKKGRRITFEYVLLKDINDRESDAKSLASIIKGIPCKINLIPFNSNNDSQFERPEESKILSFQKVLTDRGYSTFIRKSRGQDISAACGQLRGDN
ncbi:MAG: 23S rRNA (adenine(2503)-C(2))-methyltransferase RlmN [Thermodesulfovibrionales bacterium]|nr:23S rRNA (adenine(2503)-C(2))-methyltransferase RlmN [Thermodesulfovibrionales bacterium]